jgi:hypothetical protein
MLAKIPSPSLYQPPGHGLLDSPWLAKALLAGELREREEKANVGKRVAVFVMWPVTQWLIEAVFELLGFEYVSIRSEKTMKLRQEAVAKFRNPNSHLSCSSPPAPGCACSLKVAARTWQTHCV